MRRARRRTTSPRAKSAATALHWGVEPHRSVGVIAPAGAPAELVELGELITIELTRGQRVVPANSPIWLATDPGMAELYLVAETPIVNLAPSGHIVAITYDTTKGQTSAHWRHVFHLALPQLLDGQIVRGHSRFTIDEHGIHR